MTSNSAADATPSLIKFSKRKDVDNSEIASKPKNLNGYYCEHFFQRAEISQAGRVFMCCPSWLPVIIGDLNFQSMEEIWNGPRAQQVRAQIYENKNWPLCKHETCPRIQRRDLMEISKLEQMRNCEDLDNPNLVGMYHRLTDWEINAVKNKSTVADQMPNQVQIGTDESCNLYCPSCRVKKIMHTSGEIYEKRKKLNDKLFDELLSVPEDYKYEWWITGGGDPFGSKIFREKLQTLDLTNRPNTWIHMQTNGVMLTPKVWNSMSKIHSNIRSIIFSMDAATKHTYENLTRLGGDWDQLLKNINFVYDQYDSYKNFWINFSFVVQNCNYREIPDYLELVVKNWVDPGHKDSRATFSLILDWGHMDDHDERAVWKKNHPEHENFLQVLRDPRLTEWKRWADYGNMTTFWEQANE